MIQRFPVGLSPQTQQPLNHEPLNREPLNREPLNREPCLQSYFRSGFTLLELLMVVVIIGILISILMPVVNSMKQSAINRQRDAEAQLIASAIRNYHAEKGAWPDQQVLPGVYYKVYAADNATLIDYLWQNDPPLIDTNNMVKVSNYYRKPGTNNPSWWVITISNSEVTVQ